MNKIYVTIMYRFGNRETHSYVIHAGTDKQDAYQAGVDENDYRGCKYEFEVVSFENVHKRTEKGLNIEDINRD